VKGDGRLLYIHSNNFAIAPGNSGMVMKYFFERMFLLTIFYVWCFLFTCPSINVESDDKGTLAILEISYADS
jgi:hypothetical protein